jgi:opacity protein-like surface antigen
MRRSLLFVLMLLALAVPALVAQDLTVPVKNGSVKFAVIGDTGTGDKHQLAVAKQLTRRARSSRSSSSSW